MATKPSTKNKSNPAKKNEEQEKRSTFISPQYRSADKLLDQVAVITGGDSGIGRAVAVHYAKEGAHVAIVYHEHHEDAAETQQMVQQLDRECLIFRGNVALPSFCKKVMERVNQQLGGIDILVNNAAMQEPKDDIRSISSRQLQKTFEVNMFSMFYCTQEALRYMKKGSCIINTASVTAYRGSDHLIDYSATKGAIIAFTRSLSKNMATKGIRVNAVAPGPVWTPLVLTTFDKKHLAHFGDNTPMERAGYPYEIAPAFVFLANAQDASYITGQVIHVNGGEVVNS